VPVGNNPFGVAVTPDGTKAYVANEHSNSVSVINTTTNTRTDVSGLNLPVGVAVSPDGVKVYVVNFGNSSLAVINTTTNNKATVPVGSSPYEVAVTPNGAQAYVTNYGTNNVSVINTSTNTVTTSVNVGSSPIGVAVTPDGTKVYVTNYGTNNVSVINTATNTVTATVTVGSRPYGVAVTPDGKNVYVANFGAGTISAINTTTNTVTAVKVGTGPYAFGQFVGYIPATPIITWSNPANITYGTPLSSTQLDATSSVPGNFVYNPLAGTILSLGTHTLSTTFTPTDIVNYTTASASVLINVTQATPTITWNKPANITYGTALSSTQLDAISSVPGNFVYTPAAGTVLAAGLGQILSTTFTPTDTTNYTTAIDSVSINITQITPTITWSNPADITYGTPLSSNQLDANASDPVSGNPLDGSFVYTPAAGTILGAGSDQALSTTFTPTDTTNYTTASASVSINVTQATPTITWSNPANITYGTPLSSNQLDANASDPVSGVTVPGTFVYTPPSGTVFESVGTQTLNTTFVPDDTANYTTASASVLINITPATPIITWSNPANITYGTPLSSTQLDATSSVPGYFVYIQPQGTILNTGQQMLNTLFIPTDLVDYYITSATVFINVTQPAPPALAYITNSGSNNISVIDTTKDTVIATINGISIFSGSLPTGVAASPDGTKIYVGNYSSAAGPTSVSIINTTTNSLASVVDLGNGGYPFGVAVKPDGTKVYVTTSNGNLAVIDTNVNNATYNTVIASVTGMYNPMGVAVTPDGTTVYVVSQVNYPGYVYVINTTTNALDTNTPQIAVGNSPAGIAVSPDGTKAYVATWDTSPGIVYVIDTATNTVEPTTINVGNQPYGVAVTPDGKKVYVVNSIGTVSVINTSTYNVDSTVPVGSYPLGVAVTPDGSKVYVTNYYDNTVSVINTTDNSIAATVGVGEYPNSSGQFIGTPPL
jgi:YVTN family beta-propeller protein